MKHQSYVEKVLTGATLDMKDGRQLTVDTIGDYEPWDPSVGIMTGSVSVTTTDGGEYWITDDGSVYSDGGDGKKVGSGPDLIYDYD